MNSKYLTPADFVYVYEPGIGQTYQNAAYVITVQNLWVSGEQRYYAHHKGQCLAWGLKDFASAVEACARFESARREPKGGSA